MEGYDGPVDTDVARSERFMALVEQRGEPSQALRDAADVLKFLADYMRTEEFAENFKQYIEGERGK